MNGTCSVDGLGDITNGLTYADAIALAARAVADGVTWAHVYCGNELVGEYDGSRSFRRNPNRFRPTCYRVRSGRGERAWTPEAP